MKKGRHRRFEEARALKRFTLEPSAEPCVECGAAADAPCASWCLARVPDDDDETADVDDENGEVDELDAPEFGAQKDAANY